MKPYILQLFISVISFLLLSNAVQAQNITGLQSNNKDPVKISAGKTLEWHQQNKQYVAIGNVEAKQGDVIILADKLVADYHDNNKGGNVDIWQLTAHQNVRIKNTDSTALGDKAIYNVETGVATLTGSDLKLTTPEQIITAQEKMEYNTTKNTASAYGNAVIVRGTDKLNANSITAYFEKDKNGKQVLKTAHANGNITITTPDETLTGNKGIYTAINNTAEVTGNVKIMRGPNVLEGARAEINLTTNMSKMFGAPQKGQRVKAIFYPGRNKKSDN